jgi:hypothetical protein
MAEPATVRRSTAIAIALSALVIGAMGGCATGCTYEYRYNHVTGATSSATATPLAHGPQGHMTADPEPSACADAPVTSVNEINSGFLAANEYLMDIQAVVAGGATYIGANIAGPGSTKVSSQDTWAVRIGQVYAITSDARSRTTFPDGRHVQGLESWPEANAALGQCVGALERARNGGR